LRENFREPTLCQASQQRVEGIKKVSLYAETAGASSCEINILNHFYTLKSRIQLSVKEFREKNRRRL